jgi:SagB-type dehydrogenase family enzyme
MLYHENSKINASVARDLAERIGEFTTDVDELRRAATSFKTYPGAERVDLAPFLARTLPRDGLDGILLRRRSVRAFARRSLPLADLAVVLERAAGITGTMHSPDHPEITQLVRAQPSGGALYPVEIYVAALDVDGLPGGLYHFHAPQHCLEGVRAGDFRGDLARYLWIGGQALRAPAVVMLTGRWTLPLQKYGERGYRVLLFDAGHVMENLLLTATALHLGSCAVAGFHDDRLAELLAVDSREEPVLYCMLLGFAADSNDES